jgi:hypothetical protein
MHLMSALGVAAILPSLVLQGIATRPKTPGSDQSVADPDSQTSSHEPAREEGRPGADSHASNGAGSLAEAKTNLDSANGDAAGSVTGETDQRARPRRVRANPARRRSPGELAAGADSNVAAADGATPSDANGAIAEHGAPADREATLPASAGEADGTPATVKPSREERRLARARQRQEAKSKRRTETKGESKPLPAISYGDGQAAHVAMVRHLNSLTTSLNEAHRLIGRLNMEKYQAQRELAIAKKLPPPPPLPDPSWTRSAQAGPHAVRQLQRNKTGDQAPELDLEELARIRAGFKRRRAIVLGAVALLVGTIALYRTIGWTWFPDISDRDSMTQLAGIGTFVQIFFIGWIFFRFARIGGKGARWLFPDVEEEHRKQRRKERR